jgi:hypothetical protein
MTVALAKAHEEETGKAPVFQCEDDTPTNTLT